MARILIVDESPANRELLGAQLEGSGHSLTMAGSGEDAVALTSEEGPDLVLLDVRMPGIGGLATIPLLKVKAGAKFLPVILITSLSDQRSRTLGLEAGADEFLSTPVDGQELRARIRTLLALRVRDATLAQQNVDLVEHDRFKAEMSSFLVHDLRGLVAVILINHDVILRQLDAANDITLSALQDSRTAAQRVLTLLTNLLDTARMEASRLELKRSTVDVRALFEQVVAEYRPCLRARTLFVKVEGDPTLCVEADADILSRVLENLVENAIRHTPRGGRIVLRADNRDRKTRIRVGNTGVPIPQSARDLIFEKFGQASADHERMNLGLGLYFCRLALEAHGGRIWVDEAPENATEFVLELPNPRATPETRA